MDYFEAQEFFKQAYPGKQISFDFDDNCIRQIETIYTDGKMHISHHVECRKLKVTVDGILPIYVPILPHRMHMTSSQIKKKIPNDDIYWHPNELENLQKLKDENSPFLNVRLQELSDITGKSKDEISSQLK